MYLPIAERRGQSRREGMGKSFFDMMSFVWSSEAGMAQPQLRRDMDLASKVTEAGRGRESRIMRVGND